MTHSQIANIGTAGTTDLSGLGSPATSCTPKPSSNPPTCYHTIATALELVLTKHKMLPPLRMALLGIMDMLNLAAKEETCSSLTNMVNSIHDQIKADTSSLYSKLESKLTDIQMDQKKLLSLADTINRSMQILHNPAKELESRVGAASTIMDKMASATRTYRDALTSNAVTPSPLNADLKILDDVVRQSKQILIKHDSSDNNPMLNTSIADLKEKVNKIINNLSDPCHPDKVRVEGITRTRFGTLLMQLNSKEVVLWLKEPDIEMNFLKEFSDGTSFKDRSFNIMVKWVPITFDLGNRTHHREIKEVNDLTDHLISHAHWIKPERRRCKGQTHAHLILILNKAETANCIICSRIDICGVKTKAERTKHEPIQCLKCRGWEHKASDCPAMKDTCSTCGNDHHTNACTRSDKQYCVSCKTDTHASWDRVCPEFKKHCAKYDERFLENSLVYFPTTQDWMLTTRPNRILLDERFPQHLAVNSTERTGGRPPKPAICTTQRKAKASTYQAQPPQGPSEACTSKGKGKALELSKLVNMRLSSLDVHSLEGEDGELPDSTDYNHFFDHADTTHVKGLLNIDKDAPNMVGRW